MKIDSFNKLDDGTFLIEFDGFHFEGKTEKVCINAVLRYIKKEGLK